MEVSGGTCGLQLLQKFKPLVLVKILCVKDNMSFFESIYHISTYLQIYYSFIFNVLKQGAMFALCEGIHIMHMDFFKNNRRTIATRGIVLTEPEMERYGLKAIYNSYEYFDPYMNEIHAENMLEDLIYRGEFCLLETRLEGTLFKVSILTFRDIWSRNLFALSNWKHYRKAPDLETIYN